LDWKRTTVDEIVEQKRRLREKYKWVLKMLLPHVVGRQVWKNQVETGNRKPSKVATTSDEALLLVAMDCYWNVWAARQSTSLRMETGSIQGTCHLLFT
jgi:hypothetical protein